MFSINFHNLQIAGIMSSIKRFIHRLILLSCALVYGHGFTAAVVGIVTDAKMGAVPGAVVTVTNNETGGKRPTDPGCVSSFEGGSERTRSRRWSPLRKCVITT
jgi:hypothetical protein